MSAPRRRAGAGSVIAAIALLAMGLSGGGDDCGPDRFNQAGDPSRPSRDFVERM